MAIVMVLIIYASISLFGPIGYPLGILIFFILNSFAMIIIMKMFFKFVPFEKTLLYTVKCLFLNTPLIALVFAVNGIVATRSPIFIAAVATLYVFLLLLLNRIFKINMTIAELTNNLSRKILTGIIKGRRLK
jgi:hypothetical protein